MQQAIDFLQHYIAIFLLGLLLPLCSRAQDLPTFLMGDWKVEGKESYEHWDRMNGNLLKGFSYTKNNELPKVLEYMEIVQEKDSVWCKVNIPGQHDGETFSFLQRKAGSQWIYENPDNDFPQIIIYELLSDNDIQIYLKNETQEVSYKMQRVPHKSTD